VIRNRLFTSLALALVAGIPAGGCGLFTKSSDSVQRVDDLLSRVERVHVDSMIAKDKSRAAVGMLQSMASSEFGGDPIAAYTQFVDALDQSTKQADKCRSNLGPMKKAAEQVFAQWAADLESFGNLQMRQRSQARLEETRARYQGVLAAAESAQLAYDALNGDLRDHSLFLGHDFNAAAVAEIGEEVTALAQRNRDLEKRLDTCVAAAQSYVESAALPGQLRVSRTSDAPTTETEAK